jgi:hypothetical protein
MIRNSWVDYLYWQHIHRASTEELTRYWILWNYWYDMIWYHIIRIHKIILINHFDQFKSFSQIYIYTWLYMEFEYIWWPLSFASANRLWDPLHPWQIWQVGLNGTNTVAPGEASTNSSLISLWFYWLANQNSLFERAFTRLLSDRKTVLAALLGFINLFRSWYVSFSKTTK